MLQGGGKMVIAANNLKTGPGHFGRYIEEEGVEKMSFHYESDFRQEDEACWLSVLCCGRTTGLWLVMNFMPEPTR